MPHTPHELSEEFPDATARIHELKLASKHFARLADEYHKINRTIHRMETGIEPVADETALNARKQRLALKDEIAKMLG